MLYIYITYYSLFSHMVVEAAEKKYDLYWKDPAKKGFWSQLQTEHYITTSFNCNRLLMKEDQTLHSSL